LYWIRRRQRTLLGIAVFAIAFLYLWWIAGDLFNLGVDEGIYLEGARRVAAGQMVYRDFFALTGPLTFWVEGALAHWGGTDIPLLRLPMLLEVAFLAWAVYWLAAQFEGPWFASGLALVFLTLESKVHGLVVNHRWDSAALAMAAIVAALTAQRTGRRELWLAAGFLVFAAAWATPPVALVALPLLAWSAARRGALAFLGGATLSAAGGAAYLQANHSLVPMIQGLRWAGAHYTAANIVPYGAIWLGLATVGRQPAGWSYFLTTAWAAIPALLPPAAIAGWAWYLWRRKDRALAAEIWPLAAAAAAFALSAWPRWTADALLHTAALSWFLCAVLLDRVSAPRPRFWLGGAILAVSAASLAAKSAEALQYLPCETRVGTLRASYGESEFLAQVERWVQPGDSVFAFPYMPALYYFLDARNPSRYSFLQPGMMTREDEARALADLEAAPPRWVIYQKHAPEAVLAIWPGSDPALIPMERMNAWLRERYRPVDEVAGDWGNVVVMER